MFGLTEFMKSLSVQEKKQLYYAFENGITSIVEKKGLWIGVNVVPIPRYEIKETRGLWSFGRICT